MNRTTMGAVCVLAAALASCSSTYNSRYAFSPRPLNVELASADGEGGASAGRAVLSVIGLRNADGERGAEMHLRLRVENHDDEVLQLDSGLLVLLSAGLDEFGPVRVEPEPFAIEPGADGVSDLYFPLPASRALDELDLSGLNLRFGLRSGNATILVDTTFERMWGPNYDPYWGPRVRFGFGYGVSIYH